MKNPRPKLKIARKMLTKAERELHKNPFGSLAWNMRSDVKRYKELNKKELKAQLKKKPKVAFISKRSQKNGTRK